MEVVFILEVVFYQRRLNYHLEAPDVLLTALKPIATLETSLEANYDGHRMDSGRTPDGHRTDTGQKKRLIGARATALPKKLGWKCHT